MSFTRKSFLKALGIGAAAFTVPGARLFAAGDYVPEIGIQLYAVRKEIEKNFENAINQIAATGYSGVETYFLPEHIKLNYAADIIKKAGLKVLAMHADLPVDNNREAALKMAEAYNCDTVIYPGWPDNGKYLNDETLKKTVELYNEISAFLKSRGIKFGLHNHWWEFEKNEDGMYPFYYLLENLDKDIIFEIDTYWTKTAGLNPAKVVSEFGSRAPLLHIKDGPAVKGDPMYKHVPAGEGTLDFQAIVKAGGNNIKWMIVEFDEYDKDIFDGIKNSHKFLTNNKLAKGKI